MGEGGQEDVFLLSLERLPGFPRLLQPSEPDLYKCLLPGAPGARERAGPWEAFKTRFGGWGGMYACKDPDSLGCSKLGKPGNRSKNNQTTLLATLPQNAPKTFPKRSSDKWAAFGRPPIWRALRVWGGFWEGLGGGRPGVFLRVFQVFLVS